MHANILQEINRDEAVKFRHEVLAFPKSDTRTSNYYKRLMGDKIGDLELWGGMGQTLARIYCDSIRYTKEKLTCEKALRGEMINHDKGVFFHFPVYVYPKGYTILAQYPFHTHIVLSVSRAIGIAGATAEEWLTTYSEWLEATKRDVREDRRFTEVFESIRHGVESQALADIVLKKALGEKELDKKICTVSKGISNERLLIKNSLYNELFHLTGEIFQSEDEVRNYIREKGLACETK